MVFCKECGASAGRSVKSGYFSAGELLCLWRAATDGVRQPDEDGRKNPWMTLKQQTRPPWHNSSPPPVSLPPLL